MVHHESVSGLHASFIVPVGKNKNLIRLIKNITIFKLVFFRPSFRLVLTRNRDHKDYIRMFQPKANYFLSGQCIKSNCSTAYEAIEPFSVGTSDFTGRLFHDPAHFRFRQEPMACKTGCMNSCQYLFRFFHI